MQGRAACTHPWGQPVETVSCFLILSPARCHAHGILRIPAPPARSISFFRRFPTRGAPPLIKFVKGGYIVSTTFTTTRAFKALLLAGSVSAIGLSTPAFAQDEGAKKDEDSAIIVTGSR